MTAMSARSRKSIGRDDTDYMKKIEGKWLFVRTVDTAFDVKAPAK